MKTTNFLRTIATASIFAVAGVAAIAANPQVSSFPVYTSGSIFEVNGSVDKATVGAVMPYKVAAQASNLPVAVFNPSIFKWTNTGGAGFFKLSDAAGWSSTFAMGSALSTLAGAPAGYNPEYQVVTTMPAAAGSVTISALERAVLKDGTISTCDGAANTMAVTVVAQSTMAWTPTPIASCAAAANVYNYNGVAFTVNDGGTDIYVQYTISVIELDDVTATPGAVSQTYVAKVLGTVTNLEIDQTQLDAVTATCTSGATANRSAKFTITIDGVWDATAVRALNRSAVKTVPTTATASLYILPTPATNDINRLKP